MPGVPGSACLAEPAAPTARLFLGAGIVTRACSSMESLLSEGCVGTVWGHESSLRVTFADLF